MNKVFLMAIFSTLSIQASSINIGYIQFSPYIYKDSKGALKGKIVTYANKLFNEKNIIWKPTPLKRVSRSLDENRIDIFVSFFKSPQREKEVEFPKAPYLTMRPTLCGKAQDMPENLDSFDFIKDKTISFVSGTIIKDKFFGGKNIEREQFQCYLITSFNIHITEIIQVLLNIYQKIIALLLNV